MSYPAYFDPGDWNEARAAALKSSIMAGVVDQTQEVKDAWEAIADALILAANQFQSVVGAGITQVIMQADNEADENWMYLKFRIYQRTYGGGEG